MTLDYFKKQSIKTRISVITLLVRKMAAAATTTLRRIGRTASKRKENNDLYLSISPERTEWVAKHDLDMLMLDGYVADTLMRICYSL
jgi:hypothetical protein